MILGINDKARYNRRVFLFSDAALDSGSLAMGVQMLHSNLLPFELRSRNNGGGPVESHESGTH